MQVSGAGLDRIDRSQPRPGLALANAYGHEAGIAEYVVGTADALPPNHGCHPPLMLTLTLTIVAYAIIFVCICS